MALFFFDVQSGASMTIDGAGEDFSDVAAARDAALTIIASVAREEAPTTGTREFMVRVRNTVGRIVFTTSFVVEADS